MEVVMKIVLFLLFSSLAFAQNPTWLLGDWQAEAMDGVMTFSFREDASYIFNFSDDEESDEGSWSLSGKVLSLESFIYENVDYTLEQLSDTAFNLSDGDLEGTFNFIKTTHPLTTQPSNPLENQSSQSGNPLSGQASVGSEWFIGEWTAAPGLQIITLKNNPDGTYSINVQDVMNPYYEEGTWSLEGNQLTQYWKDSATGQDIQATYTIEQLTENSFNQSGGNLGDTIFYFIRAGLDPLAQLEDILITPSEPVNPLDTTTQEPTSPDTVTTPQVTAPPPAADPTVTADFMVGEWLAREAGQVFYLNFRNNGTYTWRISKWNGEVIYSEDAQWSMENAQLKQVWKNTQTGLTETAYYQPERISENAMRWRGGNFALDTIRFDRMLPNQISPLSSWLVGYWTSIIGLDTWGLTFQSDGTYTQSITPFDEETQMLKGNWKVDKDKLFLTGEKTATYNLSYLDDITSYLWGEDLGENGILFQKNNQDPRNTYQVLNFVGQYIQQDYTLTITHDGTAYKAQMLFKDVLSDYRAEAMGDTLQLKDETGWPQWTFRLDTNGLKLDSTFTLTPFWQKISESTLNPPAQLLSYWVHTERFNQDDDLLLLPDGRYRQSQYFELAGQITGGATEGLYKLEGDQLTLDPQCSEPFTYKIKQVQNHLLLGGLEGIEGDDKLSVITYMAVPQTAIDYQLAQAKLRDEITAQINAEWEGKIPFAPVNTSIGRIPASGEISFDEFPQDVFPNATVFAEQELYPFQSDYFYFYDKNGAFRSGTQGMMIVDPSFADQIDTTKGRYHDKLNTYFFPNGRMMTYSESYLTATKITYPPTPDVKFFWSKYRIEDNKIIVGEGDTQTVYELINGRRHIRLGEDCFENLKFSVSSIKQ
jgi:hypothetical protein